MKKLIVALLMVVIALAAVNFSTYEKEEVISVDIENVEYAKVGHAQMTIEDESVKVQGSDLIWIFEEKKDGLKNVNVEKHVNIFGLVKYSAELF